MRLAAAVLLALLAVPATANAVRIELRPGALPGENELAYTAGVGEVNRPSLSTGMYQPWYILDIPTLATERVPPCQEYTPEGPLFGTTWVTSVCPDDHVTSMVFDLGDEDDFGWVGGTVSPDVPVRVNGGPGKDFLGMYSNAGNVLDGGPGNDLIYSVGEYGGADTVIGGEGNDDIRTRDERSDVVSCGPGTDEVFADHLDVVGTDCETVRRPVVPVSFEVWLRGDGRPVGVTINDGATYTNTRHVTLAILRPPHVSGIRISNDGGFSSWLASPVNSAERYRFTLPSSGRDRLPKTVYVRFEGATLDPTRTFTDDIILDQNPPTVHNGRIIDRKGGRIRVALRARDSNSGVGAAQFARVRSRPWAAVKFHKRLALRRTPSWVRVRDRAGNDSRWKRVGPTDRAGRATLP
jgi:hypothetical protein